MKRKENLQINSATKNSYLPVAIQGYEGSFHEEAARHFFGKQVSIYPCDNFRTLIKSATDSKLTSAAVMAIENSIAGSILPNYNLLHQSTLTITGEIYMQIKQQLLTVQGVELDQIREVHSHTMALQQCFGYLEKQKWKLVETDDTALSAKKLSQNQSKTIAVVASKLAALHYGLQVLTPNIQTQKNNYTRFLILNRANEATPIENANKASAMFITDHSKGSLARVLTLIASFGINLSKLQSFPIPGSEFRYAFHVDLEFDNVETFYRAWDKMETVTQALKLYGIYKTGLWK